MKIVDVAPDETVLLVTGDRDWYDLEYVARAFSQLPKNTVIVHGYARGLDTIVHVVAEGLGLRTIPCPAHWQHNEKKCVEVWGPCPEDCKEVVGRPAGVIRNHWMFDTYKPSIVVGFHTHIEDSRGTRDMLQYAIKHKTPTYLHIGDGRIIQNPKL